MHTHSSKQDRDNSANDSSGVFFFPLSPPAFFPLALLALAAVVVTAAAAAVALAALESFPSVSLYVVDKIVLGEEKTQHPEKRGIRL